MSFAEWNKMSRNQDGGQRPEVCGPPRWPHLAGVGGGGRRPDPGSKGAQEPRARGEAGGSGSPGGSGGFGGSRAPRPGRLCWWWSVGVTCKEAAGRPAKWPPQELLCVVNPRGGRMASGTSRSSGLRLQAPRGGPPSMLQMGKQSHGGGGSDAPELTRGRLGASPSDRGTARPLAPLSKLGTLAMLANSPGTWGQPCLPTAHCGRAPLPPGAPEAASAASAALGRQVCVALGCTGCP